MQLLVYKYKGGHLPLEHMLRQRPLCAACGHFGFSGGGIKWVLRTRTPPPKGKPVLEGADNMRSYIPYATKNIGTLLYLVKYIPLLGGKRTGNDLHSLAAATGPELCSRLHKAQSSSWALPLALSCCILFSPKRRACYASVYDAVYISLSQKENFFELNVDIPAPSQISLSAFSFPAPWRNDTGIT